MGLDLTFFGKLLRWLLIYRESSALTRVGVTTAAEVAGITFGRIDYGFSDGNW